MAIIDSPRVTINGLTLTEQAVAPATPSSGKQVLYVSASGLQLINSSGSIAYLRDISCRVYQNSITSVTTSWPNLVFGAEAWDTDSMHSTSVNPERITINTAGKYLIGGALYLANNVVSGLRIVVDGTTAYAMQKQGNSGNPEGVTISTLLYLNAGQYLTLQAYASSSTNTGGDYPTNFWATRLI